MVKIKKRSKFKAPSTVFIHSYVGTVFAVTKTKAGGAEEASRYFIDWYMGEHGRLPKNDEHANQEAERFLKSVFTQEVSFTNR